MAYDDHWLPSRRRLRRASRAQLWRNRRREETFKRGQNCLQARSRTARERVEGWPGKCSQGATAARQAAHYDRGNECSSQGPRIVESGAEPAATCSSEFQSSLRRRCGPTEMAARDGRPLKVREPRNEQSAQAAGRGNSPQTAEASAQELRNRNVPNARVDVKVKDPHLNWRLNNSSLLLYTILYICIYIYAYLYIYTYIYPPPPLCRLPGPLVHRRRLRRGLLVVLEIAGNVGRGRRNGHQRGLVRDEQVVLLITVLGPSL